MAIVIACVKCLGKRRYTKYQLDAIKEDLEKNNNYPKVLVQIPMFNEKEVKGWIYLIFIFSCLIVHGIQMICNTETRRLVECIY